MQMVLHSLHTNSFSGIVSFRTNVPSFGVAQPTILEPAQNEILDNVTGVKLRSSAYLLLMAPASGTLKAIEFQVLSDLGGNTNPQSYTQTVTEHILQIITSLAALIEVVLLVAMILV